MRVYWSEAGGKAGFGILLAKVVPDSLSDGSGNLSFIFLVAGGNFHPSGHYDGDFSSQGKMALANLQVFPEAADFLLWY